MQFLMWYEWPNSNTDDLAEAEQLAAEVDLELRNGDDGITYILDTETDLVMPFYEDDQWRPRKAHER